MKATLKLLMTSLAWALFGLLFGSGVMLTLYVYQAHGRLEGSEAVIAGAGVVIMGLVSILYKLHKDSYMADKTVLAEDINHAMRVAAEGDVNVEKSLVILFNEFKRSLDQQSKDLKELQAETEARFMESKRQIEDYRRESWHAIDGFRRELTEFRKDTVTKSDLRDAIAPIHNLLSELVRSNRSEKSAG
jgi:hypothetical protein